MLRRSVTSAPHRVSQTPARWVHSRSMLLTPAPSLLYVIGIPAGLMVCVGVFGVAVWMLLGRISRG